MILQAQLTFAWPIWAGGYPDPAGVLALLRKNEGLLRREIEHCIMSELGSAAAVELLEYEANGFVPIGIGWHALQRG